MTDEVTKCVLSITEAWNESDAYIASVSLRAM